MEKKIKHYRESAFAWNPEKMLETIMKGIDTTEENWVEKGLPKLVDEIMENYEIHGGINHLEGKDLPSKQTVIEVLEDFFTIF